MKAHSAPQKIAILGIHRDDSLNYYIKAGDVWAVPVGRPNAKPTRVATAGIEMDYSKYLYYVDDDGDLAREPRGVGKANSKPRKGSDD